ncbi:MAG: hypothetical protein IK115_02085 [Lachnospiraceae bacterium]|nr:hypothetical protein [Lachnospiraceae bacterium]
MKLTLIYRQEDAGKNKEYIEMYRQECRRRGWKFSLYIHGKTGCGVSDAEFADTDIAVNRSRDYQLSESLEMRGIRVFNKSRVAFLGNDKFAALKQMRDWDIPVLPFNKDLPENVSFPLVMKSRDGHGGNEVFLVSKPSDADEIYAAHPDRSFFFQDFCDTPGRDLRIYVVGGKIVAAMLRESDRDFRSNYSLGGKASLREPDKKESTLAECILKHLDIDFAAIDLIYHRGEPVFNELEDAAGARMLYANSDIDIVHLFFEHMSRSI